MMLRSRLISVRCLALSLLLMLGVAFGASAGSTQQTSDLQLELSKATDHEEQMKLVAKLAEMHFGCELERDYLTKLYNMSGGDSPADSKWRITAISSICRYYYNISETDSMLVWARKVDDVKVTPDVYAGYFDIKYFYCSAYLMDGNVEKALGIALDLQKDAKKFESVDGEITCYELLGDVYMKAKAYSKAIEAYSAGFKTLKKQGKRFTYQYQFLTQILECCNERTDYDTFHTYLGEMKKLFDENKISKSRGALYDRCLKLCYAYELLDNVKHVKSLDADRCFEKLSSFKKIDDWFVEDRTTRTVAEYFTMRTQYDKALDLLNQLDSSGIDTPYGLMYSKGVLLQRLGRYDDASVQYCKAFDTLTVEYSKNLVKEFHQFRDACLDQYEKRVELENQRDRRHTITVLVSIGCVLVLLFLTCAGYLYLRSRKLKRCLEEQQLTLCADQTKLEQRRDALDSTLKRTRKDGELKTMFLSNMSHEIRNPLNAIVGFCDILVQNATDDSMQRDYARIIQENSESLITLVDNILDLGRLDSGRVSVEWRCVDMLELLSVASLPYASKSDVDNIIDESCNVKIVSDYVRLKKVLENVYSNAFRFTSQGHVKTTVDAVGDKVVIRIEDTGIGVPADKLDAIFERFEKVNTFTQGTGLGLAVCRELMKLLHGTIEADRNYQGGFAIVITLPADASTIPSPASTEI